MSSPRQTSFAREAPIRIMDENRTPFFLICLFLAPYPKIFCPIANDSRIMNQPQKFTMQSPGLSPQTMKMISSYSRQPKESVRKRVRLCLTLKLLSTTLDPVERVYLRMTIRQCICQFRNGRMQPNRFDEIVEQQLRRQVGDARWHQCEELVERLIATKNWRTASSTILEGPQPSSSLW
jgi:hypothetical protein